MSPKTKRATKPRPAPRKFKATPENEFVAVVDVRGRPTKYIPEYGPALVEFCRAGGFIEGFADSICVHVDTLIHWSKIYPDFSRFYKLARQAQKSVLMKIALAGTTGKFQKFSPGPLIFLLKACHGMRDDGLDSVEDTDMDFDFGDEATVVEPKPEEPAE